MDDMDLPGWTTHFTYDEFHPDPIFESEQLVSENFFPDVFSNKSLDEYCLCFHQSDLSENGHEYKTSEELKSAINRFKSFYKKIKLSEVKIESCQPVEGKTEVKGFYHAKATGFDHSKSEFRGEFAINLQLDQFGYWNIKQITIEGINF